MPNSSSSSELDDAELVRQIIAGDIALFEEVIERYEKLIFHQLGKHLPQHELEDYAQEVFVKAYIKLRSLKKPEKLKSWLLSISVRLACDYWRIKKYKKIHFFDEELEQIAEYISEKTHHVHLEKESLLETVEAALESLDMEDRILIQLFYLEKYSLKETAKLLEWSQAKTKIRLHRARQKLKPRMGAIFQ